jgi:hypothetical protein
MEVLQHTLEMFKSEVSTEFESNVLGMLNVIFKELDYTELSGESSVEKGLGVDIFLKKEADDSTLYFSITNESLYINSILLDMYVYPEYELPLVYDLLKSILKGEYEIELGYDENCVLVYRKVIFSSENLDRFNEVSKGYFNLKKVRNIKKIYGNKWLN